jgi:hypothetical protein
MPVTDMHFSNRSCLASLGVGEVRIRRNNFLTSAPVSGVFGELRKDNIASMRISATTSLWLVFSSSIVNGFR